jgi:plastocyanin
VVWLSPLPAPNSAGSTALAPAKRRFTLLQKNKTFTPHVLVITVGSEVDFPNKDPFFHNAFSLFEGKRFDLGLYESGSTRVSRFDRPGISYLFCNIHPEMSAVIIALDTPYYGTSNAAGEITIPNVPAGRYNLHVWSEGTSTEILKRLSRPVVISSDSSSLGKLLLPNNASFPLTHKNKYGRDYENPTPQGQEYVRP